MAGEVPSWAEETVPILGTADIAEARAWYRRLGFRTEWEHRFEPGAPVFASLRRGPDGPGVRVFLSEHRGAREAVGILYLRVADVTPVAAEFGVEIDESDGRREVFLEDPFVNRIRVGSPSGSGRGPGYSYPEDGS
jgi:catechol 2,3-dioxygenase-like lactoylglutathione lyase family enzyme